MKFLIAFALSIPVYCGAQKLVVDKLTGDTTWHSGFEKLYAKGSWSGTVGEQLKVNVSKEKTGLRLAFFVQTGKSLMFSDAADVGLRLGSGEVLRITPVGTGGRDIADGLKGSSGIVLCEIPEETAQKLLQSNVVFIRISDSSGTYNYEIKDKNQDVIKECLQKVINK